MIDPKIIEEDLQAATGHYLLLKKKVYLYFSAALLTGVLATFIAALAASNAPLFGKGEGWRWTCGLIAVLTAFSSVLTGLRERPSSKQLDKVTECVGKLKALRLNIDKENAIADYKKVVENYWEYIREK
ncbi:MAG: hypothetical protein H7122_09935 [Chitinophagaceae bacterium]|nr:hypothetical protein [Chitinophagaceae bacterium]